MVKHIVMWKLKDNISTTEKINEALEIKKRLERLHSVIIELKEMEVGMNFSLSERAYDIVLYTEFDSKKDLEHYMQHPEHINVRNYIDNIKAEAAVVDFEI